MKFDRHNGIWGFLVNENTGVKQLAPVFACGYAPMDEQKVISIDKR